MGLVACVLHAWSHGGPGWGEGSSGKSAHSGKKILLVAAMVEVGSFFP
jgi:hypothetical protein